ncbi:YrbL family protein [Marinobacter sp.]|uniref:YrbL family protein n=1 Tax=Marinobacter sp. TaxID=50741 RepID=UPI0038505B5D
MIDLSNSKPFASGANRDCFRHPDNPDLCLKVVRPEARTRQQSVVRTLPGRRRPDDNQQELAAYHQSAIRNLLGQGREELVWAHLPRFYGTTETSRGKANVSQLILDSRAMPAKTLERYLQDQRLDPAIEAAIARFDAWLAATGILTRNLLPHNLVVAETGPQPELFLIDGLGAPAVPNRLAILRPWRRRYVSRKIRRFHLRIRWELAGRKGRWRDAQKL